MIICHLKVKQLENANGVIILQRKWAYTKEGTKALGGKKAVQEWERATGNKKLPKVAPKKKGK